MAAFLLLMITIPFFDIDMSSQDFLIPIIHQGNVKRNGEQLGTSKQLELLLLYLDIDHSEMERCANMLMLWQATPPIHLGPCGEIKSQRQG